MGLIQNTFPSNPIDVSTFALHLPTNTTEEEAKLQLYLDAAVGYFERAGNFSIPETSWTYTTTGLAIVYCLPRSPLIEVTAFEVLVNGVWVDFADYTVDDGRQLAWVFPNVNTFPTPDCVSPNVKITFTAGYVPSSSGSGESLGIPPLLKRGIFALATHYYDNRGVTGDDTEIPFGVSTILSLYKNTNA